MNIFELDDTTWEKTVEQVDKPVFIMFSSPTCPHCAQMEPHFVEYAKEFKDTVVFAKINIANSPTIASRYGVMGTPTFKFFCHGKPVSEITGAIYPTLLKKTVEEGLQSGPKCTENTTWLDTSITGYA